MKGFRQTCSHVTHKYGYRYPCNNTAKVEVKGQLFCGVHDPESHGKRSELVKRTWVEKRRKVSSSPSLTKSFDMCQDHINPVV